MNIVERLKARTEVSPTNCWLWFGSKDGNGYGKIKIEHRMYKIHRISASLYLGLELDSILPVLHKDNLCRNRNCWNPEHLYVGTLSQNTNDSVKFGTHIHAKRTHCPKGHLLDGVRHYHTIARGKSRYCLTCHRDRMRMKNKTDVKQKQLD